MIHRQQNVIRHIVNIKIHRKEEKIELYDALIKSRLSYGAETWRLTENSKRPVKATEVDCLRISFRISR
jgi:hypothetical protein